MHSDTAHSLYEVDHAGFGVGHLPVLGQPFLVLVSGQHAPGPEVHGTAGLRVAGYGLPPVGGAFLMLCNRRENRKREKVWMDEKMQVLNASCIKCTV